MVRVAALKLRVAGRQGRLRVWVARLVSALALALIGFVAWLIGSNPAMDWPTIGEYLFNSSVLSGVMLTIAMTVIVQVIATVFGIVLALGSSSGNGVARGIVQGYIAVFRAIPPLLQLLFWFNLAIFFPQIGVELPLGLGFSGETNTIITPFVACVIGLTLCDAAYMAEIIRGGLLAVPAGQRDAALALGMTPRLGFRRVVFPQALRVIVPATGNAVIGLVKSTALVSVVGAGDLLTNVQRISAQNFKVLPLLFVATIWYLVIVAVITVLQRILERHLSTDRGKGSFSRRRRSPQTELQGEGMAW